MITEYGHTIQNYLFIDEKKNIDRSTKMKSRTQGRQKQTECRRGRQHCRGVQTRGRAINCEWVRGLGLGC